MLISTTSSFLRQVCMDPRTSGHNVDAGCMLPSGESAHCGWLWLMIIVRALYEYSYLLTHWLTLSARRATLYTNAGKVTQTDWWKPGARFTKYLTAILRLSYDNAKVTIDLRRTSNLQKHPTKGARFFLGTIHSQTCKIVRDSVHKLAYDIPKRNFSTF